MIHVRKCRVVYLSCLIEDKFNINAAVKKRYDDISNDVGKHLLDVGKCRVFYRSRLIEDKFYSYSAVKKQL